MPQTEDVRSLYTAFQEEFRSVNNCIAAELCSDVALVEQIGQHILGAGGKRLRPLLVLLSASACGYKGTQHIVLAAIIECLHTATLLHDDVVDASDLRRGRLTANAHWGNAPSVLVGDFLYSRAFQMMVRLKNLAVMDALAKATNVIAEGEVMQLANVRNLQTTESEYMRTICCKTAALFAVSSQSAALLAGVDETRVQAFRRYGEHLGMAFQLTDDLLDYTGDQSELGKNPGDDLAEGKLTLPLIHALNQRPEAVSMVEQALAADGPDARDPVMQLVNESGALDYTVRSAHRQVEQAIAALDGMTHGTSRQALEKLARFSVSRMA
ncbi:MAG: polyprenyl synthetase family protein [Kistimonas sp.]|nr:polyprenyl synthetase family protein [Kistimonas sp.]